jgi:glycerol-1-phosphate dehydrogenase [NAD(P)+]
MAVIDPRFFHVVYGRKLLAEIPAIANPPYLVVTMKDIWPKFQGDLQTEDARVYFVETLESDDLKKDLIDIGRFNSVIGVGGGMALDVAKYFAWLNNLPLIQCPTTTSVNAAFTERAGIRFNRSVHYVGMKIPEVVYVDYGVIQDAPSHLNRAGVGDVFCIHTAHGDWKLATKAGMAGIFPYDPEFAAQAQEVLQNTRAKTKEIFNVTEEGIRTVMEAHRWTGTTYHNSGWNPRYIEGAEHFFFYALEYLTGKHFVHGEPVSLGIIFISYLQENDPEGIWKSIDESGVQIRPEQMGVTWEEVENALKQTRARSVADNRWYSVINEKEIPDWLVPKVRERLS